MTVLRHSLSFVNGGGARLTRTKRIRTACCRRPVHAELGRALVIGANRGLGLALAHALAGDPGTAATIATTRRRSNADALSQVPDVQIVELDVRDRDRVFAVLAESKADVVFSCFGGSATDDDRPDYPGNQNLIDAAEESNVKRFVLLSALGASESEGSVPFQVMITMRSLLLDKSRAELYLTESKLEWTIVRPVPLTDEPKTGTGMLSTGFKCYGTISREDLAEVIVRAADSAAASRATLTAIDRTRLLLTSPYVRPLEFWEPLPVDEFELN